MGLLAGALGYGQPAAPPPPVGVRVERFEVGTAGPVGPMALSMGSEVSIEMTVVKGAPFSGEFVTESMQQLADGNRIASKRSEVYARDAEGRTRREMGPVTFIHDPVAKVDLILENQKKTARKITMPDLPTPPAGQNVLFLSTMAPPPGWPPTRRHQVRPHRGRGRRSGSVRHKNRTARQAHDRGHRGRGDPDDGDRAGRRRR
jgi:hypothetical protein